MVRAVSDDVPLLLTIFDPTIAEQMAHELPSLPARGSWWFMLESGLAEGKA